MHTLTISIGRNLPGGGALNDGAWAAFRAGVRSIVAPRGTVHVDAAYSVGEWDGVAEESATFVVGGVTADGAAGIAREAAALARHYQQDAVAVTTGTTALL